MPAHREALNPWGGEWEELLFGKICYFFQQLMLNSLSMTSVLNISLAPQEVCQSVPWSLPGWWGMETVLMSCMSVTAPFLHSMILSPSRFDELLNEKECLRFWRIRSSGDDLCPVARHARSCELSRLDSLLRVTWLYNCGFHVWMNSAGRWRWGISWLRYALEKLLHGILELLSIQWRSSVAMMRALSLILQNDLL